MNYNFDQVIDRTNQNSMKWDCKPGELSMGIADMDFQVAPAIQQAVMDKVNFGVFGYADTPKQYFESYQYWWKTYHNFDMDTNWMVYSSGVVPALSSIVRKLTTPNENVLIQSPVYNIFYNSIINNGRHVLSSDLVYEDGSYHIDWNDLESKLADPQTSLMILCNPHNPIGKIWDKETLARIGQLAYDNHVIVVSDEIHCDIVKPGFTYVPFASVNKINKQNSITCLSCSKAFNCAGLQCACVVVPDANLRHKVWRGINTDEVGEANHFACDATIAAFTQSRDWLEQLNRYVYDNRLWATQFMEDYMPQCHVIDANATYLLWVEIDESIDDVSNFVDFLQTNQGLYISKGQSYGSNAKRFVRINLATSKAMVEDGFNRFYQGYLNYKK